MIAINQSIKSRVLANYDTGRTQLCRQDIEHIRNWSINPNITADRNSELVETGRDELRGIGQRFQRAFPTIFPTSYNRSLFLFRATDRQRTVDSLESFAEAIFIASGSPNIQFEPLTNPDILMRVRQSSMFLKLNLEQLFNCSLMTLVHFMMK